MTMPQTSPLGDAPVKRGIIRQLGVDTVYSLFGLVLAVASFVLIITGLSLGLSLLITVIGFPVLALTMLIARGMADTHRVAIAGVLGRPSPRPAYLRSEPGAGWFRRTLRPLRDAQSWLDVVAGIIDLPFAIIAFVFATVWWAAGLGGITYGLWQWALPNDPDNKDLSYWLGFGQSTTARIWTNEVLGLIFVLTLPFVIRGAAMLRAIIARALLCGIAEMRHEITGLQEQNKAAARPRPPRCAGWSGTSTTARSSDWYGSRWTSAGPRSNWTPTRRGPRYLDQALTQTREALDELRALSRGIAPPILTDRGLAAALVSLAGRNPVPVELAVAPDSGHAVRAARPSRPPPTSPWSPRR